MSLQEAFAEIEKNGEGLSNRLEQKRKIEEFRQEVVGLDSLASLTLILEPPRTRFLFGIKDLVIQTEVLDRLIEAVDLLSWPEFDIKYSPDESSPTEIRLQLGWEIVLGAVCSIKALNVHIDMDKIEINSGKDNMPENSDWYRTDYFSEELDAEQWKDPRRVETAVADALWSANVRLPAEL